MKFTKKLGAALTGAGLAFAMSAGLSLAQDVTLKLHQMLPEQAIVPSKVLIPWMAKIEKESGGRIKFEHYPAMQLGGKPAELMDQVQDGVADVVWTLPGYTPGRYSRTEVIELPFMMQNAEGASRTLWRLGEKYMFDKDFKDVKVLAMFTHGPGVIHSNKPITTPEDLKGVNLRAPTRVTNMMVTALGANAIGMPVPAVAEALSKGVIDATILPWEVTRSIKSSELVKNHTEFPGAPLYTAAFVIAMNKDVYNGLPDDLRAIVDANSGEAFSALAGKATEDGDAPARQIAVDLGNNIIELTPDQIAVWKAAAEPTVNTWLEEMKAAGITEAPQMLIEARAMIAEYAK